MNRLILMSVLVLLLAACGGKNPTQTTEPETPAPVAVARLTLPRDTMLAITLPSPVEQSYSIYIPSRAIHIDSAPAVIFFDPHGSGSLPVEKYHKLADRFGIILIGSNNSKNGLDIQVSSSYGNNIIADITTRVGIAAGNICLSGFSGGSKVALYETDNNNNINSVIYLGATSAFNPTHSVHMLGFAGTADMNYSDLVQFDEGYNQKYPGSSQLVEFNGKHEWPDTATFRKAFYWIYFRSGDKNSSEFKKNVSEFISGQESQITKSKEDLLSAVNAYNQLIYILQDATDVSQFKVQRDNLYKDASFQQAMERKNQALQKENSEKQILMSAFQKEDGNWWYKTISHYKASKDPVDKRLLGFVSLGCYSYSSQLLSRGDTAGASHFLAIYELADPDNTDQLYFHAVLNAMENKPDRVFSYLSKAVKEGFEDRAKIEAEPAFTPWRGDERFSRLLSSLKKGSR